MACRIGHDRIDPSVRNDGASAARFGGVTTTIEPLEESILLWSLGDAFALRLPPACGWPTGGVPRLEPTVLLCEVEELIDEKADTEGNNLYFLGARQLWQVLRVRFAASWSLRQKLPRE